ncbi:hypothetical protein [Nostoc sp. CHAB 5715]|uniref:hypothetical protein n=1 Tax=Nostoc sp. CHAB 5715 TaxID=2780400 RepID=UPI001E3BA952|nr:hypothetical protein [Nostoc sp. CHAB 5715]MCC5621474.1 hypothetical protein [Nostoc sp. CHAB 5715]
MLVIKIQVLFIQKLVRSPMTNRGAATRHHDFDPIITFGVVKRFQVLIIAD